MPALALTFLSQQELATKSSDTDIVSIMHQFHLISVIRCTMCAEGMIFFYQNRDYENV